MSVNIDDNGVRFTVISLNSLDPDTSNWLWTESENLSEKVAYEEARAEIRERLEEEAQDSGEDLDDDEIDREVDRQVENLEIHIEEPTLYGESEGVKYEISFLGGAPLLWVLHSPHTALFRLCSPCCPNACDGNNPDEDGFLGYDVPKGWRIE